MESVNLSKKSLNKFPNLFEYFEGTRPLFLCVEVFHDDHRMLVKLAKRLFMHKKEEEAKCISHKYDLFLFEKNENIE